MFFRKDKQGRLRQLPINATEEDIITDDGETLNLDHKKLLEESMCIPGA